MSNKALAKAKSSPAKKRPREQWDRSAVDHCAPTFGEGISFNNRPFSDSPEAFEGIAEVRRPSRTAPLAAVAEVTDEFLAWEAASDEAWDTLGD